MSRESFAVQTFKLTRKFNHLMAVNGIDLQIVKGELLSLLGPNGAGKTTTINMLCCLLKPTSGTASILDYDITKHPFRVKKLIGIAPQETAISDYLNCWENLALIGKIHGMSPKEVHRRSEELLERVGLIERAREEVRKFSGGMKRRLNLIMALVHDPEVLFLDEPSLGLDPQSRRTLWEYIEGLKGKKTILLTTHYMEEADSLSDRIAIIDQGHIVTLGTSEELKYSVLETRIMTISVGKVTPEQMKELRLKYSRVEEANGKLRISHPKMDLKSVIDHLHYQGITAYSATLEQPSLEDVFLQITGKKLRQ